MQKARRTVHARTRTLGSLVQPFVCGTHAKARFADLDQPCGTDLNPER